MQEIYTYYVVFEIHKESLFLKIVRSFMIIKIKYIVNYYYKLLSLVLISSSIFFAFKNVYNKLLKRDSYFIMRLSQRAI